MDTATIDTLRLAPAPDQIRVYVAGLIARQGVRKTAQEIGLSRHMVTAIATGAPVQSGTRRMALEAARARGVIL